MRPVQCVRLEVSLLLALWMHRSLLFLQAPHNIFLSIQNGALRGSGGGWSMKSSLFLQLPTWALPLCFCSWSGQTNQQDRSSTPGFTSRARCDLSFPFGHWWSLDHRLLLGYLFTAKLPCCLCFIPVFTGLQVALCPQPFLFPRILACLLYPHERFSVYLNVSLTYFSMLFSTTPLLIIQYF